VRLGFPISFCQLSGFSFKTPFLPFGTYFYSGLTPDEVIDLVPVKPIGDSEAQIKAIYRDKLIPLFEKIKP